MRETAAQQIIRIQKQEAPFICSACGADRGCDCNAPAIEKLAAYRERERQKKIRQRQKANKNNDHVPGDMIIEIIDENENGDENDGLDVQENLAQEPDLHDYENVEDPKKIKNDICELVGDHRAVAEAYRKICKAAHFDS
jgi:hypothetical protein